MYVGCLQMQTLFLPDIILIKPLSVINLPNLQCVYVGVTQHRLQPCCLITSLCFSSISSFPNIYLLVVDGSITLRLALRDPTNVSCGVRKDLWLLMAASVTFLSTPSAMNKAAVCLIYRTLFITESWIDSCWTASERLVASYRITASSFYKSSLYINEKVVCSPNYYSFVLFLMDLTILNYFASCQ